MTEDITLLTGWLQHPYRLATQEEEQLSALLKKYPYLVPARYMEAGVAYATSGFSADLLHEIQLYQGNWMHFYEAMKSSTGVKAAQPEVVAAPKTEKVVTAEAEPIPELIQPVFAENYFLHQGIAVPDEIPAEMDNARQHEEEADEKALMVMMGFDEWLNFLKRKNERKRSEEEDKAMLKAMWQKEKLAAAMGEEDEEIPEAVFEMAINSIDKEDVLVSESLAEIHVKQGKYDKAIEIYKKLSLQNPQKKSYFAAKIDNLNKEKQS
jgi:tetratricopeptide (TPR) repeat protein